MKSVDTFNNFDYIKLSKLDILPNISLVILYARFMKNADWAYTPHTHSFYELHFPLEGSCSLKMQDTEDIVTLNTGEYLLIHPGTLHRFMEYSDDFHRLSIAFDIQYNNNPYVEDNMYKIDCTGEKIDGILHSLIAENIDQTIGYKNLITLNIEMILVEFLRMCPHLLNNGQLTANTEQKTFYKAITFIRDNVAANISVEDVAKHLNMSSRHLNRIFNANIDSTVAGFIRRERNKKVIDYLENTDLSIYEIAILTGFKDECLLNKMFKRMNGTSPGRYRSSKRQKHLDVY